MATTTLQLSHVFPVGTTVGAYQVWDPPPQGSLPAGTPVEATVAAGGAATFEGLEDGLPYVAAALVDGAVRFVHFASGWDATDVEGAFDDAARATDQEVADAIARHASDAYAHGFPLDWVNVKSFGAEGAGGDDTDAIVDAVAYLVSLGGGTLFFPTGDYGLSGTINLPAAVRIRFVGAGLPVDFTGAGGTRLRRLSGTAAMIDAPTVTNANRLYFDVIGMELNGGGTAGKILVTPRLKSSHFDQLRITNCPGATGWHITQAFNCTAGTVYVHACGLGTATPAVLFDAYAESQGSTVSFQFANLKTEGNAGTDIKMTGVSPTAPTTDVQIANLEQEGGVSGQSDGSPYLDLAYVAGVKIGNYLIGMHHGRTAVPIQQGSVGDNGEYTQIANLTVESQGATGPTDVIRVILGGMVVGSVVYVAASTGVLTRSVVRVESGVALGAVKIGHTSNTGVPTFSDARSPQLPTVAAAPTVTLRSDLDFHVISAGTGSIDTITAGRASRVTVLFFSGSVTLKSTVGGTGTGNLALKGGDVAAVANDVIFLVSNGSSWLKRTL